jgi:dihydroflavonol-4-reductase
MPEALILGATGFIGGQIARTAAAQGWSISGLRRRKKAVGSIQDLAITWYDGSLSDRKSLDQALEGKDIVFHAAGFYPPDNDFKNTPHYLQQAENQINTVLDAVRSSSIQKLIYTSSLTTIGQPPSGKSRLADERDRYQPRTLPDNAYYEAKILMEDRVLQAAEEGLFAVILNPTTVFGPGDVHLSTGEILLLIARGKAVAVPQGTVNIIDVRDVAQAHISAAENGKSGERYILGGRNFQIRKAAEIVARAAGAPLPKLTLPDWMLKLYINAADRIPLIPPAPFHIRAFKLWQGYNTEKAIQELGLATRPLPTTINDSLSWFKDQGKF